MTKFLFLDFDGCLLPTRFKHYLATRYKETKGQIVSRDEFGFFFDPTSVNFLAEIYAKTNCSIVVSSSWRHRLGMDRLYQMWKNRRMPGMLYDITEHTDFCRGEEINMFLQQNSYDSYCIVDDCEEMLPEQLPFFVKTDSKLGITKNDCQRIINILNKL